jgi:hypothetical protein
MDPEEIAIETSRVGHPLLVKVSYHPRWRAQGALGPYLVSPALMLIVPTQERVRLLYARRWSDHAGLLLTAAGTLVLMLAPRRRRPAVEKGGAVAVALEACEGGAPRARRWGGLVPGTALLLLASGRLLSTAPDRSAERLELYALASRAYAAERFSDAAEYSRLALGLGGEPEWRAELQCLRGESLLRVGQAEAAALAFDAVTEEFAHSPHAAQALFGSAAAREALGQGAAAAALRDRLLREFPKTPWAERVRPKKP